MTKKKHLYEVDLMRRFFMFGVVLNHVASTFAAALGNKATPAGRFLVSTHLILHFLRFGFMFITGLVLFLGYWGRPKKKTGRSSGKSAISAAVFPTSSGTASFWPFSC